jgi:hypothetical protein
MCKEHWWNETDSRKQQYKEKLVPAPLCAPQIPHALAWIKPWPVPWFTGVANHVNHGWHSPLDSGIKGETHKWC